MSAGKRMFTVQSRIQIILSTLAVTGIHTFVSLGNCAVSAVCVLVGKYNYVIARNVISWLIVSLNFLSTHCVWDVVYNHDICLCDVHLRTHLATFIG